MGIDTIDPHCLRWRWANDGGTRGRRRCQQVLADGLAATCTGERRWTRLSVSMRLLPVTCAHRHIRQQAAGAPLAIEINP
jgi:hypothetical protein